MAEGSGAQLVIEALQHEGIDTVYVLPPGDPPRPQGDSCAIEEALHVLRTAERPLMIIGKGTAWSRAEDDGDSPSPALERSFNSGKASPINAVMDPLTARRLQEYGWLDRRGQMKY